MLTGAYQNPDEVVAHALDLLSSADELLPDEQASVEEKIERAFGQFERGKFFSAEESRANCSQNVPVHMVRLSSFSNVTFPNLRFAASGLACSSACNAK